jgi:hypothetical protein
MDSNCSERRRGPLAQYQPAGPVAAIGKARPRAPAVEGPPRDRGGDTRRGHFELVERLAEREERDWTCFGRLRHEPEKKLRDPQDVLIEADRLRQQLRPHNPRPG